MSLFNYADMSVSLDELNKLIIDQTSEKRTIDYKLNLELNSDEQKKEFLADIISFANTDGGVLIYGMKEKEAIPIELVGLSTDNIDILKGRIESIIRDGIDPKLNTVKVIDVKIKAALFALVIKVPKSWASPHLVWYKKSSKFFARNSSHGKYQLEISEIRTSILASENQYERIRGFRLDRISKIINSEIPVSIDDAPKFVFHIIPISAITIHQEIQSSKFYALMNSPNPLTGFRMQFNFEGFLLHNVSDSYPADQYIQIFRNGIIEMVNTNFTDIKDGINLIYGTRLERFYIQEIQKFIELIKFLGYDFPIVIMLTVLSIRGYKFFVLDEYSFRISNNLIDRDNLLLPDIMIDEDPKDNWDITLRSIFDPIYYACGMGGSLNYDGTGKWVGDKR